MFGMGFMEIFLILVVAIIALGPEKLPQAAVDIAKFFKKLKSGIEDAKATLDNEINISAMKQEAKNLKEQIELDKLTSIDLNSKVEDFIEDNVGDFNLDDVLDATNSKKAKTKQEEKKA